MPNSDHPLAPASPLLAPASPPLRRLPRLLHPRRWLAARRIAHENGSALSFGARLFLAIALTFALIGVIGYTLVDHNLEQRQIAHYAADVQADARGFEEVGAHASTRAQALRDIDQLLDAIARRPGTLEALLIDQRHVVTAASEDRLVGTTEADPRIDAALEHGSSSAGRESDPRKDRRNFEFVVPVELPGGRYAYEVNYDHRTYDAQLHEVRMVLLLVGLLALFGGGAVFYLVGGRALMRDHRTALQRATRDGLTDLPNQRAFQDELPQAVGAAIRYQDPLALIILDIDDFKFINDRHGHPYGDDVLGRVAEVLREARPGDRPYRIGGDEFALLLAHTDSGGARTLARRLSRSFSEAGVEVSIGVSALRPGRSEAPAAGGADTLRAAGGADTLRAAGGADTLRAEADAALYEAKRQGGNRSAHFDDIRERVIVTTTEKKEAVRRLIDEGRLETVFQPIWDFGTERMLGVEALTRPDPSYGLSGPEEAFDIAAQIGRVRQLDVLCVQSALRVVPELEDDVLLFLNLSPHTLDLDSEQNDWVRLAVEQAGLPLERVVIEVSERFGGRTAAVVKCLQRLRKQGFKTALDDVGTGNSGLEMLRRVDVEYVKLDPSIVLAAPTEPTARAVLMAMATFARQTGAFVIAEGIEDEDTLQFLRAIDAHDLHADTVIQGGQGAQLGRPASSISPHLPATAASPRATA
ncbi:MAG TPA: bifunctional diguanylate cyclase/phosphodiesterase [Solirubrobacteraceae bacterium]